MHLQFQICSMKDLSISINLNFNIIRNINRRIRIYNWRNNVRYTNTNIRSQINNLLFYIIFNSRNFFEFLDVFNIKMKIFNFNFNIINEFRGNFLKGIILYEIHKHRVFILFFYLLHPIAKYTFLFLNYLTQLNKHHLNFCCIFFKSFILDTFFTNLIYQTFPIYQITSSMLILTSTIRYPTYKRFLSTCWCPTNSFHSVLINTFRNLIHTLVFFIIIQIINNHKFIQNQIRERDRFNNYKFIGIFFLKSQYFVLLIQTIQQKMAQNPLGKYLIDPKLYPDPDKIKVQELMKYNSLEWSKIQQSIKNYKGSRLYIGSCLGLFLVVGFLADKFAKGNLVGQNGNGGNYLKMYSTKSTADYSYNRQFQRMRYLIESPNPDDQNLKTNPQLLANLNVEQKQYGLNPNIRKLAPHPKYY